MDCCPETLEQLDLSQTDDIYFDAVDGVCVKSLDGEDAIHDEGERNVLIAGDGDDVVTTLAAFAVFGGRGNDQIESDVEGGEIDGGEGDDLISTGQGHHIISPGPGVDVVESGPGTIILQVLDECELQAGESYVADGPDDLLVIPISLDALGLIGVTVAGFERVAVVGPTCLSSCAPDNCVAGEVAS